MSYQNPPRGIKRSRSARSPQNPLPLEDPTRGCGQDTLPRVAACHSQW
ncbi:hypothetical protein OROMI_008548 [Orobanche minor]